MTTTTACPYIGLRYFEERDAALFYGRDEHVIDLLTVFSGNRFVAVLGSSGSGKSSLVRAGLIPELRAGMVPEAGSRWKIVEFQPRNKPLGELAEAIETTLGVGDAATILTEGPLGLAAVVRAAQLDSNVNVLVIADQFEEVFRFQREAPEPQKQAAEDECHSLVRRLLEATACNLPIYVLLVMRSDYLGECAQFPDLPERISESLYLVPRLRRDQLQEAITGPMSNAVEPALVQRLLSDLGNDQDQLPRLQHMLARLWNHNATHEMCSDDYTALGGWKGGLSNDLNQIHNRLTERQQNVCECVLRQLFERDENNRDIRRRATVKELEEVCGQREEVLAVIATLHKRGFFRLSGELSDETLIEVTHECILRGWDKLVGTPSQKGWLQEEVEIRDFYLELKRRSRRPHPPRVTGSDLRIALKNFRSRRFNALWARRYGSDADFKEVQRYVNRSALKARSLLIAFTALFVTVVSLGVYAIWASRQGEQRALQQWQQERIARAQELTAHAAISQTADPATALFLGWQAAQLGAPLTPGLQQVFDDALLNGSSRAILRGHQASVQTAAWSPNGKFLASASSDDTVRVWDAATGKELRALRGHLGPVQSVAWSPDSEWLASASVDKSIRVWDLVSDKEPRVLLGHQGAVQSVAWSPDSKWLASAASDSTVKLWNATTGEMLRTLRGHKGPLWCVAWSPDGKSLASSGSDSNIRIWSVTGRGTRTLYGHIGPVQSVAWSPSGKTLASAGYDQTIRTWSATTGRSLTIFRGHQGAIWSVAWDPDGKLLASASADNTLKLWDVVISHELLTLHGHQGAAQSVSWSPDGKSLASAGADGTIRLWDTSGQGLYTLRGHQGAATSVAWSPDDRFVASASFDKTIKIWDVKAGVEFRTLRGHKDHVQSVTWSPDGKFLASASSDKTVIIWDANAGKELQTFRGHRSRVQSVSWSPDGKLIASAGFDKLVRVWDPATGKELRTLDGHRSFVWSVAWSPNGKLLSSASTDQTVIIWDATTGKELHTLSGHQYRVQSVAWSPDGKFLASGSFDQTIKLWDPAAGHIIRTLGDQGHVWSLSWSPDGKSLASGSSDTMIRIWNAATGQELRTVRRSHQGTVWSVAWSHNGKSLAFSSDDPSTHIYFYPVDYSLLLDSVRKRIRQVTLSPEECEHYFGSKTCPEVK